MDVLDGVNLIPPPNRITDDREPTGNLAVGGVTPGNYVIVARSIPINSTVKDNKGTRDSPTHEGEHNITKNRKPEENEPIKVAPDTRIVDECDVEAITENAMTILSAFGATPDV